ncbi:hypothetical protein P7K49_009830, partial [Saguinus oedipus]
MWVTGTRRAAAVHKWSGGRDEGGQVDGMKVYFRGRSNAAVKSLHVLELEESHLDLEFLSLAKHAPLTMLDIESVKFRDVAVVFSPDEWDYLNPEQKNLYKDVMMDSCNYLASLGNWTYRAKVMSSLKQGKEPWMMEREVTGVPCPGKKQLEVIITHISTQSNLDTPPPTPTR